MKESFETLKKYDCLQELLLDKDLARLGDAYVNFVYSISVSQRNRKPTGAKVNNQILSDAVEKSQLRKFLPHRVDRHTRSNAAESLLVFAWLNGILELNDCVHILSRSEEPTEAFSNLLKEVLKKLDVSPEGK
jgi:CRISPR/Cas system CSM-associated protein Csm2 small subunit